MSWRSIGVASSSARIGGMDNSDRRPTSSADLKAGALALLLLVLTAAYGLPLAILLWRAAL